MLKTKSEIARLKGVSPAAVNKFFSKHDISAAGKKGKLLTFDCSKEPLSSYLSGKAPRSAPPAKAAAAPVPDIPTPEAVIQKKRRRYELPLNDLLAQGGGATLSAVLYKEAIESARKNEDAGLLQKLAAAIDKEAKDDIIREQMRKTEKAREQIALEKANALKLRNEIEMGVYIRRDTVKLLMGRVYAIHTSVLQPLGLKLAGTIASIPEGAKKELQIKEFIDAEIFSALGGIQRLLISEAGGE